MADKTSGKDKSRQPGRASEEKNISLWDCRPRLFYGNRLVQYMKLRFKR